MRSFILLGALVSSWALFTASDSARAQLPTRTGKQARIRVIVPSPNANLCFSDTLTQQKGTNRFFVSPPLEEGYKYTYTITVSWRENGREFTREKHVKVRPGQETLVDFTAQETPAERPLTPPIAPESERPLTPPIAPEPDTEEPPRRA